MVCYIDHVRAYIIQRNSPTRIGHVGDFALGLESNLFAGLGFNPRRDAEKSLLGVEHDADGTRTAVDADGRAERGMIDRG